MVTRVGTGERCANSPHMHVSDGRCPVPNGFSTKVRCSPPPPPIPQITNGVELKEHEAPSRYLALDDDHARFNLNDSFAFPTDPIGYYRGISPWHWLGQICE